ncbi:MAG: prepilin-type N-terminal cleavage/methylation domain-containing protein [Pseudomonadota bacterium]
MEIKPRVTTVTRKDSGFTIIELMMAMVISLLVMSAIFTTFRSQTRSWVVEQETANMQQNLRAGMYRIEKAVFMAGYDPQNSKKFGFLANLPSPYDGDGATTDGSNLAMSMDSDGDQVVDGNDNELIAFRINSQNELQIHSTGAVRWQTIAENISNLSFTYLDASNAPTATLADIRTVQVAMTATSGTGVTDRTRTLSRRIGCRNR